MLTLAQFKNLVNVSKKQICEEIFAENADKIKVKKPERVVKNLARIFDATLSISNAKGFQAMSLRDLSEGSGLSMGALYSYFTSKDELVSMIQEQGRRITTRVLTDQVTAADGPADQLKAAIVGHLYLSEVMQPWFYFSYMEAKNLPKKQRKEAIASELAAESLFVRILEQGRRQGVFRETDPRLTAAAIKAVLQDWYLKRWKYRSRKVTVENYARFVLDWVERFLAPDSGEAT
ncbi:MAG: TetR family transcriptional regulator [Deltaproteobacteria bacterium]|nr:TetR family transcriptional regulator [Deltaproteobacteria bacterium]